MLFFITSPLAWANQSATGWCQLGGQVVVLSGLNSTTQVQAAYPGCTVTVNVVGGGTATIFSDNSGTPLANPFTANSTTGQWTFYAANGHYAVTLSGGGLPTTVTLPDVLLNDPSVATSFTGTFFQSSTANPAASGVFRLASGDIGLSWRNNANSADISFTKTPGDVVTLGGALSIGANALTAGAATFSSVTNTGNSTISGNLSVTGTLGVTGATTLGTLTASSSTLGATSTGAITASGAITAGSNAISGGAGTFSGQITSTLAPGTAPLVVSSSTQVNNLNVSQLEGKTWEIPGTIGSTTPATGAFTTLAASTSLSIAGGTALTTTNRTGTGNLVLQAGAALASPSLTSATFLTGISQGSGHKHQRFGTLCTTAAGAGATCTTAVTWTSAFADANYTVVCTGITQVNVPALSVEAVAGAGFTIRISAITAAAASFTTADCIADHD